MTIGWPAAPLTITSITWPVNKRRPLRMVSSHFVKPRLCLGYVRNASPARWWITRRVITHSPAKKQKQKQKKNTKTNTNHITDMEPQSQVLLGDDHSLINPLLLNKLPPCLCSGPTHANVCFSSGWPHPHLTCISIWSHWDERSKVNWPGLLTRKFKQATLSVAGS